ncbi:MAG: hypothetical protein A3E79_15060 [Burkholderiales bacterium RIFCSPHIGHO2_12_FULL_61_11]|nr:MAG: hypothetical protein A3E79_15060 [Burkholderiales bacterium RIFCSPHIGHO2_12_FULL_61_11]
MDRADALVALDRKILDAYSRRTTHTLRAALPLRLALPHIEPVLARNVAKEMQKDALVIRRAGEALVAGSPPNGEALRRLLDATKEIDRAFLTQVGSLPLRIVIPYEEILPVRMKRIECLSGAAYRILGAWQMQSGVRAALQASYPRAELERLLFDLLQLYALETRILSRSVRLPILLAPVRERIAKSLQEIMNDMAERLAAELAAVVYRR